MMSRTVLLTLLLLATAPAIGGPIPQTAAACEVTMPNWIGIGGDPVPGVHGNGRLQVGLWLDGITFIGADSRGSAFVTSDGELGTYFKWRRDVEGPLSLSGRRLDGPAPPMRSFIPDPDKMDGFVHTSAMFPTAGCWELTGRVGEASLTFVTQVVQVGDELPPRRDPGEPIAPGMAR
jgi:hypothetical protein